MFTACRSCLFSNLYNPSSQLVRHIVSTLLDGQSVWRKTTPASVGEDVDSRLKSLLKMVVYVHLLPATLVIHIEQLVDCVCVSTQYF